MGHAINEEEMTEMTYGTAAEGTTILADTVLQQRRWTQDRRLVFCYNDAPEIFYAFDYDEPLTEASDSGDEGHRGPDSIYFVYPHTITKTVYLPEGEKP